MSDAQVSHNLIESDIWIAVERHRFGGFDLEETVIGEVTSYLVWLEPNEERDIVSCHCDVERVLTRLSDLSNLKSKSYLRRQSYCAFEELTWTLELPKLESFNLPGNA